MMARRTGIPSLLGTWGAGVAAALTVGLTGCAGSAGSVSPVTASGQASAIAPPSGSLGSTDGGATTSAATASLATATTSPGSVVTGEAAQIAPSVPRELFLPKTGTSIPIATKPCPVVNGLLDPDRSHLETACYYTAPDRPYSLPGTSAADLTVLAGHTWRKGPAAFNALYDWRTQAFAVSQGDELWVRTEASGQRWLVYRAVSFHTPTKDGGLANDTSVWGTAPIPGRLLTIGCLQPTDLSQASTRNVVVAWDLGAVVTR